MTSRQVQSGRVLINYASASTLQQIHGVGEATIALILARRCANDNWTPDAAVRLLTNRHLTPEIILECFDFTKNPMPNMSLGGDISPDREGAGPTSTTSTPIHPGLGRNYSGGNHRQHVNHDVSEIGFVDSITGVPTHSGNSVVCSSSSSIASFAPKTVPAQPRHASIPEGRTAWEYTQRTQHQDLPPKIETAREPRRLSEPTPGINQVPQNSAPQASFQRPILNPAQAGMVFPPAGAYPMPPSNMFPPGYSPGYMFPPTVGPVPMFMPPQGMGQPHILPYPWVMPRDYRQEISEGQHNERSHLEAHTKTLKLLPPHVANTLRATPEQVSQTAFKVSLPATIKFTGEGKDKSWEVFLAEFLTFLDGQRIEDFRGFYYYLSLAVQGTAAEQLQLIMSHKVYSKEFILEKMAERYANHELAQAARYKFLQLEQTEEESDEAFASQVYQTCHRAFPFATPKDMESIVIDRFCSGLKDIECRQHMTSLNFVTMADTSAALRKFKQAKLISQAPKDQPSKSVRKVSFGVSDRDKEMEELRALVNQLSLDLKATTASQKTTSDSGSSYRRNTSISPSRGRSRSPSPHPCFNCGQVGHRWRQCPQEYKQQGNA